MDPIALPANAAPRVSILIVTARQPRLLARCLETIAQHGSSVPFEVVLVLNDAQPEVVELVRTRVSGATVRASSVPLGLAGGTNRGRAVARGELLVMLHDDTEVEPGWLDELVATVDAHPEAGAVGCRMLQLDGSAQSMGSILWRDGTVWTLGRGAEALAPESETTTAVDYCGSSALLVRAATWDALGGADERFYPAFYVDVDLCLGVWKLGQAVLAAPGARVRHHLSASTDLPFRTFLLHRNAGLLREKWAPELARLEAPATGSAEAVARAVERAQERWREAARAYSAYPLSAASRSPFEEAAQERRVLEVALALERAWYGELKRGFAEREATLKAALEAALQRERRGKEDLAEALEALARAGPLAERLARTEQEVAHLRERDSLLARIESGRWWRLYGRLQPLLGWARRFTRRAGANRTE